MISETPLVSIITVVYNGEKYLQQTIESVMGQTYGNIEYLVIDGKSNDSTLEIIKNHEKHIDLWISEKDEGLYDAMNKGIRLAKGELIGMINSDDWFEKDAVELVVSNYLKQKGKRIFHGDRYNVHENEKKTVRRFQPSTFKFLFYGMTYNHPSMFVHREIYKNNLYNIHLKSLSDYEFILKQFLSNRTVIKYIPQAYVNYRLDGISSRMNFFNILSEGYLSRKNAGMNLVQNSFSVIFRFSIFLFFKIGSTLKKGFSTKHKSK